MKSGEGALVVCERIEVSSENKEESSSVSRVLTVRSCFSEKGLSLVNEVICVTRLGCGVSNPCELGKDHSLILQIDSL